MRRAASCCLALIVIAACGAPTAPDAVLVSPGDVMVSGTGATGRWAPRGHSVTGTTTLVVQNGVAKLDFSSDFTVAGSPGPFVYLNTTNNPNSGQPLRVAALKSRQGTQSYTFQVPTGVRYTWVLIWCDPLNVAIAEASIPATP